MSRDPQTPLFWEEVPYDWRRHGPWWGALAGGFGVPFGLFMLAGLIAGDTGGPLIWPLAGAFFGSLGLLLGFLARAEWCESPRRPFRPIPKSGIPRWAWWTAGGLAAMGAIFLFDASRMPRLRRADYYHREYNKLGLQMVDDEKFRRLRAECLTDKTAEENLGATLLVCGIAIPLAVWWHKRRRVLLQACWKVSLFGLFAAGVSGASDAADLFLMKSRGELPWWRDSLTTELLTLPVMAFFRVLWLAGHSLLIVSDPGRSRGQWFRFVRAWLILQLLAVAGFLGWAIVRGDFLAIAPRALWFVFYYAILRGHVRTGRIIAF